MTPTRIYLVRDRHSGDETLVRAPHAAQALRHVTASQFEVAVARQEQLVALLTDGAAIEDAGAGAGQGEEERA